MATSGLVVMARGIEAQRSLSLAFEERRVHKRYTAVVAGELVNPQPDNGWNTIELPLLADWPNRPLQKVDHEHGKPSTTRWRIAPGHTAPGTTRLELEPVTGRTHQLRVHLQALGHPMVGDALYAAPTGCCCRTPPTARPWNSTAPAPSRHTMTPQHLTILTGASRGMGLAMARQLLGTDRHLLCISRQVNDELAAEAKALGATLTQWSQDLADTTGAANRLQAFLESQPASTWASATLINNAGVIPRIGSLDQCPPEDLANALRVGLEAPMQLTAAFLRATTAWVDAGWRGPRKVLNISSGLGRSAMAAQAPYCAAKAGMDHFTRCSALDEAHREHGARRRCNCARATRPLFPTAAALWNSSARASSQRLTRRPRACSPI